MAPPQSPAKCHLPALQEQEVVAGRSVHTSGLGRNAAVSRMGRKGSESRNHSLCPVQGDQKRKDPNAPVPG